MTAGSVFASSIGQGTDLFTALRRLAIERRALEQRGQEFLSRQLLDERTEARLRDALEQRGQEFLSRQLLDENRFKASQRTQSRIEDAEAFRRMSAIDRLNREETQDQASAKLFKTLGGFEALGLQDFEDFTGPVTPEFPNTGFSATDLDPVIQDQFTRRKLDEQRESIRLARKDAKAQEAISRITAQRSQDRNRLTALRAARSEMDPLDVRSKATDDEIDSLESRVRRADDLLDVAEMSAFSNSLGIPPGIAERATRPDETPAQSERREFGRAQDSLKDNVTRFDGLVRLGERNGFDDGDVVGQDNDGNDITLAQAKKRAADARRALADLRRGGAAPSRPDAPSAPSASSGPSESLIRRAAVNLRNSGVIVLTRELLAAEIERIQQSEGR